MSSSLINISFRSEQQAQRRSMDEEGESIASNYVDYIDNFRQNFNNVIEANVERSEEHAENNLLIFNDDEEISANISVPLDIDSSLYEGRRDFSQIFNKNLSVLNIVVIPEEPDISFTSNRQILSLLDEDKNSFEEESFTSSSSQKFSADNSLNRFFDLQTDRPHSFPLLNLSAKNLTIKFVDQNNASFEFILSCGGIQGSLKNTSNTDVTIGRMRSCGGIRPNDIVLTKDPRVSRIHCRLITKYFFGNYTKLSRKLVTFVLCVESRRSRPISRGIIWTIYQFLRKESSLMLQDLGSSAGTFIKVTKSKPKLLQINSNFKLGSQANFTVIYIKNQFSPIITTRKNIQLHACNTTFVGFEASDFEMAKKLLLTKKFIMLRTHNCPSEITEFLILNAIEGKRYVIGRQPECDLSVNLQDISRKQCELTYENGAWVLSDGFKDKSSKNGTWMNIKQGRGRKRPSSKVCLGLEDTFMVSDHIFSTSLH